MILTWITLAGLAFIQTVAFALVSRARNRNHMGYHAVASVLSNGIFFLTFRQLVINDMTFLLFVPYVIGTVSGSLFGAAVSIRIEKWLGATT